MPTRRELLAVLSGIVTLSRGCLPNNASAQFPTQGQRIWGQGGEAPTAPGSGGNAAGSSAFGCTIFGSAARLRFQGMPMSACHYHPAVNQAVMFEPNVLRNVFGLAPAFACYDDSAGPNAFATPELLLGYGDGTVMFGTNLLLAESNRPFFDTAVVGIMAHEWGHISQFNVGLFKRGKGMELHADFLAGWYLGWKAANGSMFNVEGLAQSLFSKGDFDFNNPDHHGTPQERVASMIEGFEFAIHSSRGLFLGSTALRQAFENAFEEGRSLFDL